jgi:Bacterial self-protective colicin-like immunity
VTRDDWRALLEAFLSDESDAETFQEEFLEAWKNANDDRTAIPDSIGDLFYAVESFDKEEEETETELRDEAQKALAQLAKNA